MLTRGTSVLWPSAISSLLSQYINLFFWVLGWTLLCLDDTVLKNLPLFPGIFALQSCCPWYLTISFLNQSKLTLPRPRDCTLPPSVLTAPRILDSAMARSLQPSLPLITMSSTNPSLLVSSSRSICEPHQLALPIPVSKRYPCHPPEMLVSQHPPFHQMSVLPKVKEV